MLKDPPTTSLAEILHGVVPSASVSLTTSGLAAPYLLPRLHGHGELLPAVDSPTNPHKFTPGGNVPTSWIECDDMQV
jgi:hypothetical protein